MIRNRRGQMRIVEAMITCVILVLALSAAVYISSVYSVAEAQGLEETGLNIIHVLDDSTIIRKILNNETGWQSELRGLIETLLPPDTFYNLSLFSAVTGQTIVEAVTNIVGQEVSEVSDVITLRDVATVSFPTLKRESQKIDVMLVIDRSGSMGEKEPGDEYTKMDYAKNASKAFVDQLDMSKDKVGVVSFYGDTDGDPSDDAEINAYLTSDSEQVKSNITELSPLTYTDIGAGINKANEEFLSPRARSDSVWVMVLLSDGCANRPYNESYAREYAISEAENAAGMGVVIYTIGLGANTSSFDEDLLKNDMEPVEYYYAPSAEDLTDIYMAIIRDLSFKVEYDMVVLQLTLVRPG